MTHNYIGLISGTSVDGIDGAVVQIDDDRVQLGATVCFQYPGEIKEQLQDLIRNPTNVDLDTLGHLDTAVGRCFAEAAMAVLQAAEMRAENIRAIGCHGQTVRHTPTGANPFTMQIGDPNRIVEHTGIVTVADFRRRDIAAGGEGAPLASVFHAHVFTSDEPRAVVNIGGIGNITVLDPNSPVLGFDTGPGNTLMDLWVQQSQGASFDDNGQWAATGQVDETLLKYLLADPYFAQAPPKSTGREHFSDTWLRATVRKLDCHPANADVQRTLLELTARTIANDLIKHAGNVSRVLICGGGAHNSVLLERLSELLSPRTVETTSAYGIDPDWVEAALFGWLAHRTQEGQTGN